MKETALSKTTPHVEASSVSSTSKDVDVVSFAVVGAMGFISAFVGGGALLCFGAALIKAGPLELINGFLSAITVL